MRGKIIAQSDSTVNAHPAILTSWNGDGTGCIVFFGVISCAQPHRIRAS
jgi:hypothetical protein